MGIPTQTDASASEGYLLLAEALAKGAPDAAGAYDVAHSSGVFIFDRGGRARLLARPDDPAPAITADLARLLAGD